MSVSRDAEKESDHRDASQMSGLLEEGSPDQNQHHEDTSVKDYAERPPSIIKSTAEQISSGIDAGTRRDADEAGEQTINDDKINQGFPVPVEERKLFEDWKDTIDDFDYPEITEPRDPARILSRNDLRKQRLVFWVIIASLNIGMTMIAVFAHTGLVVFVFILFIKSKDFLSCVLSALGLLTRRIYHIFKPLSPVPRQWILTLIPAYSESEEQIVKTIYSLRDNDVGKHRQVMVVLLDGRPRDIKSHMTRIIRDFKRPYVTLKHKRGTLNITAGFANDVPVIVIEKVKNSGKIETDECWYTSN